MAVGKVDAGGFQLTVERNGAGRPIMLAHGLTATRRYVVHGSKLLERSDFEVLSYDARGHGESDPAPSPDRYTYPELTEDLLAVIDDAGIEKAVFAGVSMGAATTLRFALEHPERVAGLIQITPAQTGAPLEDEAAIARWDALADGLERNGVDGFMEAYGEPPIEERFRGLVKQAIRQRIERHQHPQAVADALRVVPRSQPFEGEQTLAEVAVPTLIVASRDDLDPEHPLAVAERYDQFIPNSELVVEAPGESPLAWRGAKLSRAIADFVARI